MLKPFREFLKMEAELHIGCFYVESLNVSVYVSYDVHI